MVDRAYNPGAFQEDYGYERQPGDVTEPPLLEQIYEGAPGFAYEMNPIVGANNLVGAFGNILTGQGGAGDYAEAGLAAAGATPLGKMAAFMALPAIRRLNAAGMGAKAIGQPDAYEGAFNAYMRGAKPEEVWNEYGWTPQSAWGDVDRKTARQLVTYADTPVTMNDLGREAFERTPVGQEIRGRAGGAFMFGDIFEAPELMAAYPDMRYLRMGGSDDYAGRFSVVGDEGRLGGSFGTRRIPGVDAVEPVQFGVQARNPYQVERIMDHEVDHAASVMDDPTARLIRSRQDLSKRGMSRDMDQELMLAGGNREDPNFMSSVRNTQYLNMPAELRAREAAKRRLYDLDTNEMMTPGQINTFDHKAMGPVYSPREAEEAGLAYRLRGIK